MRAFNRIARPLFVVPCSFLDHMRSFSPREAQTRTPDRHILMSALSSESAQLLVVIGRRLICNTESDSKRTAFRSPWQSETAKRFVGSVRRELLNQVVVLNEDHLRRLLRDYVAYYNDERVHTSIGDSPAGRDVESRPSEHAKVPGLPHVGGLHHRYRWREAA